MIDERVVLGPATPDGPVAAEVRHAEMVLDGVVRQVRMLHRTALAARYLPVQVSGEQ